MAEEIWFFGSGASLGDETLAERLSQIEESQGRKIAKEPYKGDRCCTVGGKMSEFYMGFRPESYEQGSAESGWWPTVWVAMPPPRL